MKRKYESCGLNYDMIHEIYPDEMEFETILSAYLDDPFFGELEEMLDDEDYAMAKDAIKGLYILAGDLRIYNLYTALMDIYEDLEEEIYSDVMGHYKDMKEIYDSIRGAFCA